MLLYLTDALTIIITAGGLLVCFLLGHWYTKVEKSQQSLASMQTDISVQDKEHEMDIKRIDWETKQLRLLNDKAELTLRKETTLLQKDMRTMAKSISKVVATSLAHDTAIRNNQSEIEKLKEATKDIKNEK